MHSSILITGASGFIGQELTTALLGSSVELHLTITDIVAPQIPAACSSYSSQITTQQSDLTAASSVDSLLSKKYDVVYLLHGLMSGAAEANLEIGLRVNVDSFRLILDALRVQSPDTVVVFPSSIAVYGPAKTGEVFSESTCPIPQSSYGSEKLIVETLLNDFSRRGLLDGRIVRLPTVIVRPGKPSGAASSFASGIVRESLKGEKNILPVDEELEMWVCSPEIVVKNLVAMRDVPRQRFGNSRVVCLPGQTVSVAQILEALEEVGGKQKRAMVKKVKDPAIEEIVRSWPARMDTSLAKSLGLVSDISLKEIVDTFARTLHS